jgi:hypothetical protein
VKPSDLRDARALVMLLEATLVGCGHTYPGSRWTAIEAPPRGAALTSRSLDDATCRALCNRGDIEVSGCHRVTLDIAAEPQAQPERRRATVWCSADYDKGGSAGSYDRTLPVELESSARHGESVALPDSLCHDICLPLGQGNVVYTGHCKVGPLPESRPPRAPRDTPPGPDEVFLACDYHVPPHWDLLGNLPSGRLMQGTGAFAGLANSSSEYFTRVAYYEAASVVAFRQLAVELTDLGAPTRLVRAALRGARDEGAHTRAMLGLARRVTSGRATTRRWPTLPRVRRTPRPLVDLAIENATAGCVGETFGTWVALHQSRHARDPAIRRVAAGIARDEARHAALAWRVFDWLDARLDEDGRARVRGAMADATRETDRPLPVRADVARVLGLPLPACGIAARVGACSPFLGQQSLTEGGVPAVRT